jgi:transposase
LTLSRESFERIYRSEQDVKTKERMLLVLNVVYHGMVAAHVARDLHRCKAWACEWLKRYYKEGTDGLKSRLKSGRPPELSEEASYIIKKRTKRKQPGLDHKAG